MSSPDQTASSNNQEPKLCKMGCGFFGNNATEDMCSKCFLDLQKQKTQCSVVPPRKDEPEQRPPPEEQLETPMELDSATTTTDNTTTPTTTLTTEPPAKKKKKKKTSYKAMMAAMKEPSCNSKDDKESIRKATGGGQFSKIDKI